MDREPAFIRAEISQTRADLDRKLARLEARARELTPRRAARRFVHERRFEQILGTILVFAGSLFAWKQRPWRPRLYDFRARV
jgi:hypothetical protein